MPIFRTEAVLTGLGGSPYLSTLYFDATQGTASDATNAVQRFWTAMRTQLSSVLQVAISGEVALINEVTGQIQGVLPATASTVTGTATGDVLPYSSQGLIRWRTGLYLGGREIRGRTFIPGFTESSGQSGRPTGDAIGYMTAGATALHSEEAAQHVVWSRSQGGIAPVTISSPWTEWAVLRSRRD